MQRTTTRTPHETIPLTIAHDCVLVSFVPAPPPTDPYHLAREAGEVAAQSAAGEGQAQPQPTTRINRVLGLLRGLVTYGRHLAYGLRCSAGTQAFIFRARPFGTTELPAILVHITRDITLAAALYRRLARRAAQGRDLAPLKLRTPAPRNLAASPRSRSAPARPARPQPAPDDVTLPTQEQIAALLRRPIGVVLTDICREFGIRQADVEPALWRELVFAIIEYGGSLSRYLIETNRRTFAFLSEPSAHLAPAPSGSRPAEALEPPQSPMPGIHPPALAGACPRAGLQPDPRGPPLGLPVAA
jgi:hypothetical protein